MRTHPDNLPSRRSMERQYEELFEDYEELLEHIWGYRLRAWGDIHQMTIDKIRADKAIIEEMKEKIDVWEEERQED